MSTGRSLVDPELVEVGSGVFAYIQHDGSWMVNNAGVITGDDGSYLLIDTTSTEARNRALLAAVQKITGKDIEAEPPRALVNTHHHGDHTFGNWLIPARTPVIGHVTCREDVLAAGLVAAQLLTGPDYGHIEVRPPDVTFTGSMTLHLGDRLVELHHLGPAHTRSDVVGWLPEERVLFAGDIVFAGGQPFLVEGSVVGYLAGLAAIRALEPEIVVPGHGPVCRGAEVGRVLDDLTEYAAFVAEVGRAGYEAGRTPLEAATAARVNRFTGWQETERLVGNLYRAYSELNGDPIGARVPLDAVWADMVAFNGGPIGCFA